MRSLLRPLSIALPFSYFPHSVARKHGFKHEAVDALQQRQAEPTVTIQSSLESHTATITIPGQCPAQNSTAPEVISVVFPSPSASPVEITSQSQTVTSYMPEMTWCVGPAIGRIPTAVISGVPPYTNDTTLYAITTAGSSKCETVYVPTVTTVCATTLTGLASKVTISECDQEVTFSSECGFTLETPSPSTSNFTTLITPAPTVKRMMTYWLAPWQSLTLGETPSDVDIKVCEILENEKLKCTRFQEVWEVVVVTHTTTTEREIQVSTTVSGPGTIYVETLQTEITDTVVFFNLSTTLLLESEIEVETTSKKPKPVIVTTPRSTQYVTKLVKYKSTSQPEPTSIVRVTSTRTEHIGTITRTKIRLPPRPKLLDVFPQI